MAGRDLWDAGIVERLFSSPMSLLGFALTASGLGSMVVHVGLLCLQTQASVFVAVALLGLALIFQDLYAGGRLFGYSAGDLAELALRRCRGAALQCLGLFTAVLAWDVAEARAEGEAKSDDAFDAAVQWLQRPQLSLGLAEQLELRGLYLQAKDGDEGAPPPPPELACEEEGSCGAVVGPVQPPPPLRQGCGTLACAELRSWRALRGLPRPAARAQLPLALAEVDPAFVAAHPRLPLARYSDTLPITALVSQLLLPRPPDADELVVGMMERFSFQMIARRLPPDLDEQVFRAKRGLLHVAATAAALATFLAALGAAVRRRRWAGPGGRPLLSLLVALLAKQRWPPRLALAGAVSSLYLHAVAHGLPAWLLAAVLPQQPPRGLTPGDAAVAERFDVTAQLRRHLLRAVAPKVSRPLFLED